jgi:hypothetical protein
MPACRDGDERQMVTTSQAAQRGAVRKLSPRGWALYCAVLFLCVEAAARFLWASTYGVSFFDADDWIHTFYPELRAVAAHHASRDDDVFDVLLLGGSVLASEWGDVAQAVETKLRFELQRRVAVHNVARPGHTSLDSANKYARLQGSRFDLVILYDGVNDIRANNCPDEIFRADYTHFAWYAQIASYQGGVAHAWSTFPLTARHVAIALEDLWGWRRFLPRERPRPEWLQFGSKVKTAQPFERNITEVARLARERGDPLVVSTFAHYIAPGYTHDRFTARQLDYGKHSVPIELWGLPSHVGAALAAHNAVLERVARTSGGAVLVDQNQLIPKSGAYFNDLCHLTHRGSDRFVENLLQTIRYRLAHFASARARS